MTDDVIVGDPSDIAENLAHVRDRICSAGGDLARVRIIAVSKGFPEEAILAAHTLGIRDFGENYADEFLSKSNAIDTVGVQDVAWHFLGAIQRNKVGRLAPRVSLFHGIDRAVEGEAIAACNPGAGVLVEVDSTGSAARGGVAPEDVPALVDALRESGVAVKGLMTIAPHNDQEGASQAFHTVGRLVERLQLAEASMGMTEDLELAVAEGATMIRIGRGLFGPRPARRGMPQ